MTRASKLALVAAAFVLVPSLALAKGPPPTASLPAKAKAYGRYCQGESKKHVKGTKGTPFSQCVTAMAKLATHRTKDPWNACSGLSRRLVPGATGSPFSRCVVAGTRLLNDLRKP